MSPLKIGIVGLKCLDHLTGAEVPRYLGGIETQLATLAKGLASQGCEVSLITFDHGQADDLEVDGVRVLKSHAPDAGIRLVRTVHPRTTGLLRAMRRAAADVYLQMGAGMETGQVSLGCRQLNRPFVFCMASDADFGAHLASGPLGLEGRAYRFGLKQACTIVAQTEAQRAGLRAATGLESNIIPMAIIPPDGTAEPDERPHVLWVGRIMPTKRLEWLLAAARRCPEAVFDIVGTPNQQSEHATHLMEEARRMPNVNVHGRAPASKLANLYEGATLFACTSELEGFPTTFLEAWSLGVPVVTTFDPDNVVATHGLGEVAGDLDDFISKLTGLLADPTRREIFAAAARLYYQSNHSIAEVSRRFKEMLENAAGKKPKERVVAALYERRSE
jgi:glycosyltransferase involved in cell wall biosynthesis